MKKINGIYMENYKNLRLQFVIRFPKIIDDKESSIKGIFHSNIYKDVNILKIDKVITDRGNVLIDITYECENTKRYNATLVFKNWKLSTNIPSEETNRKLELVNKFINKLGSLKHDDFGLIVFILEAGDGDYNITGITVYDDHDKIVCKISNNDK